MMDIFASLLIIAGGLFMLIAAIGVIRFKDTYSRMHATTKATSFALLLIIIGVSISFGTLMVYIKALLIIIFIYLTAPLAAHSIARSISPKNPDQEE